MDLLQIVHTKEWAWGLLSVANELDQDFLVHGTGSLMRQWLTVAMFSREVYTKS